MSELDVLNDLDDIEDDDFKVKKLKKKKNKKNETADKELDKTVDVIMEEDKAKEQEEANIFVTNNPTISTSYKDKLLKIYQELEAITEEEIQNEINDLKKQILDLLKEKEASDERMNQLATEEIDKKMQFEKDLHYLPKTKQNIIHGAVDETKIFTPTNMLLLSIFAMLLITSLILVIKL